MHEFEELINNDKHLSKLLNEKEITVFSNFSRSVYSPELKEYISERYLAIFRTLFRTYIQSNELGLANALIRSTDYLATEPVKQELAGEFGDLLKATHEYLEGFKIPLNDSTQSVKFRAKLEETIDGMTINILNRFDAYDPVKEYKQKILQAAFDICELTAKSSPSREAFKYALHEAVMKNISSINELGSFQEVYDAQKKKSEKKAFKVEMKYVILLFVAIVLILLRLLMRLDR